jgi:hypothetical protein
VDRLPPSWNNPPKTTVAAAGDRTPRECGRWLVVCPACGRCARLQRWVYRPDVLTCTRCGLARDHRGRSELWLRVACCGRSLWARSATHLAFLESYVAAGLRERSRLNWADREHLAKLPKWMCLAKNRAELLRGFAALRERLAEA